MTGIVSGPPDPDPPDGETIVEPTRTGVGQFLPATPGPDSLLAAADAGVRGEPTSALQGALQAMQDAWNTFASRLKTKLDALKEPVPDYTFDELVCYLRDYKRRNPRTIQKYTAQLAFMERHPNMPVQLHSGRYALVNSFYLYIRYRETVEGNGGTATINDHKAMRALGDFLGIPREIWPTAPVLPMTDERWIPSPEEVYDLLHADYTSYASTSYDNALVKTLLTFDFLVGPRFPSEAHALKLRDFRPEPHVLVITEPKKSLRRRTLLLEPEWPCCSRRHYSLGNYLPWRDKVDPERRQEAFFLQADGTPFTSKYALNKFTKDLVQAKFPWFYSYLGRHWCATARLIDWGFDYARVADWLGHEQVDMTRREYEHNARLHQRLYGDDWLTRAGRRRVSPKPAKNG